MFIGHAATSWRAGCIPRHAGRSSILSQCAAWGRRQRVAGPHTARGERYCHLLREESKPCEPEIGTELWTWKKPATQPWIEAKPIAIKSAGAAQPGPQNAVHLELPVRTPKSASPAAAIVAGAGETLAQRDLRKALLFDSAIERGGGDIICALSALSDLPRPTANGNREGHIVCFYDFSSTEVSTQCAPTNV